MKTQAFARKSRSWRCRGIGPFAAGFALLIGLCSPAAGQDPGGQEPRAPGSGVPVGAQSAGTSEAVRAVLSRTPAESAAERQALDLALASLTSGEIVELCDLVKPPGTDGPDDDAARMALHALAVRVSAPDQAAHRQLFNEAVATALGLDRPVEAKAFLIRQLELSGTEDSIRVLRGLVREEALAAPAIRALVAIGGQKADEAARSALIGAERHNRVALINAVAELGAERARRTILPLVTENDPEIRRAAISAMARLGAAAPREALLASDRGQSWEQRVWYAATALEYAAAAEASRGLQAAERAYRRLLNGYTAADESHIRCAALCGLADVLGAEAIPQVVEALTGDAPDYRATARQIVLGLEGAGVTPALTAQLESASSELRVELIEILAERDDRAAFDAVVKHLDDENQGVRIAAIEAAAPLGGDNALRYLRPLLDSPEDPIRDAARQSLAEIPGETATSFVVNAVLEASPRARAALLDVLVLREEREQIPTVLATVTDKNETVRLAAIRAAGALGDERALDKLTERLGEDLTDDEREAIEAALVEVTQRMGAPASRKLLAAVDPAQEAAYASLLGVFGPLGGHDAFHKLQDAAADDRARIREAAVRALQLWPDGAQAPAALEIASSLEDQRLHVLAFRAFLRLAGMLATDDAGRALELYQQALPVARRSEEKKAVLGQMGELRTPQAIDPLRAQLDDGALSGEAAAALVRLAQGLVDQDWRAARTAAKAALEGGASSDALRDRADSVLARVKDYAGYITEWQVAGPYTVSGKSGPELFDEAFAPERTDARGSVEWQEQPVTEDPAYYWFIDINRSVGADNSAAYLRTYVDSQQEQRVQLEFGSDDGLKVWLNDALIHGNNAARGCTRGQDFVDATLQAGWNELLLKVTNGGGGFAACARVLSPDGEVLPVETRATPPDAATAQSE